MVTLSQQFLRGLVGVHVRFFEHGVDIRFRVVSDDFFDGLDCFTNAGGEDLGRRIFYSRNRDHLRRKIQERTNPSNGSIEREREEKRVESL